MRTQGTKYPICDLILVNSFWNIVLQIFINIQSFFFFMFLGNLSQKGQCDHVLPHNYRWQKQATFVSDGQMCIVAEN